MLRKVTNPAGKTAEIDANVYLDGEIQYGETDYDVILWTVEDSDLQTLNMSIFRGIKVLVVPEKKFNRLVTVQELGFYV